MPQLSELMETIGLILQVVVALFGALFVAIWLSLVVWTFRDIRARSRDPLAQVLATLLVLIFNLPGFCLYFLLRPRETLMEAYERALEEEALLQDIEETLYCPGCKRKMEPDFLLCPFCHTRLKKRCPECGRLLQLQWNVCPYCGQGLLAPSPAPSSESPEEGEAG